MIDVYSLCPGGSGKKIKFCCRNRVDDFRKIYKFLDANQHTACLNYMDGLLKQDSECACLLAIRCVILKAMPNREEELIETAKRFYGFHPENPIAIAESAQAILMEGQKAIAEKYGALSPYQRSAAMPMEREELREVIRETMRRYEKAFATEHPFQYEQVIYKLETFVKTLIKAGFYESANAWMGLILEMDLNPSFQEIIVNTMQQFKTSRAIQLCFRVGLKVQNARVGVPWEEEFNAIVQNFMLRLRWSQAITAYQALAQKYPDVKKASEFWFNMALLHEWECDLPSAATLWEEYLGCEGISFYDALEKRIRLSFFKECLLEDEMNICTLDFPVSDSEAVLQRLTEESTFRQVTELQSQQMEEGVLRAAFDILDAPVAENEENLEPEDIPVVVGNGILWEKQEEQPARLEVINVLQGGAAFVTEAVREVVAPWLVGEVKQSVTRSISVTLDSILRKIALPTGLSDEKVREIKNKHCRAILLERWVHFPLGILKNMSMKKAATYPEMRVLVETVIYALRYILEREKLNTDVLKEIREELGLSPMPEIEMSALDSISPIFFDQLKAGNWAPETLEHVFLISRVFNTNNIPREILEQAAADVRYPATLRIEILKTLWSMNPQAKRSLEIIEKGHALCAENQLPDVFFDIMEVAYSINEGKFQTVFEKIKHIRQEHADDEEAMQYVTQLSQYMYGIIQNMNPTDLIAFQQQSMGNIPVMDGMNIFGTQNFLEGITRSIRSGSLAEASADLSARVKKD
ncbi:MAG: hypothetical protein Q4C70_08680 [Planctomycetia bacterium]|nr:hypothetical protein [Planctomycetia bacterium]